MSVNETQKDTKTVIDGAKLNAEDVYWMVVEEMERAKNTARKKVRVH